MAIIGRKKDHLKDDKINTEEELVYESKEKLWETNPMEALRYEKIETRKN